MGQKQCEKCSELVDDAKAFCPGCGNAFVEEKTRSSVSDFDQSRRTVQLGQTMYNELLSDMGLKPQVRKGPDEKRIEVIAPAAPPAVPPRSEVQTKSAAAPSKISTRTIVIIAAVASFLLIGAVVIVVAAAAILYFLKA